MAVFPLSNLEVGWKSGESFQQQSSVSPRSQAHLTNNDRQRAKMFSGETMTLIRSLSRTTCATQTPSLGRHKGLPNQANRTKTPWPCWLYQLLFSSTPEIWAETAAQRSTDVHSSPGLPCQGALAFKQETLDETHFVFCSGEMQNFKTNLKLFFFLDVEWGLKHQARETLFPLLMLWSASVTTNWPQRLSCASWLL